MNILIPIATGSEEMEAVILIDVFRRAEWSVTVAGVDARLITASRGVMLQADTDLDQALQHSYDAVILPGGVGGMERMRDCEGLIRHLQQADEQKKWIGAICAAPLVLDRAGLLHHRRYTSYPSTKDLFQAGEWCDEAVVKDGNLITSQGPGTAFDFALAWVAELESDEKARELAEQMVYARV